MNWINCTGDVVTGDTIRFSEGVFGGSRRKPKYLGERQVVAKVVNDSYGIKKQQHTFTIVVLESSGFRPLDTGKRITRKGRNVYRNGTQRRLWDDEDKRETTLHEKHARGDVARDGP